MSQKRKMEWDYFLNEQNQITYNELCLRCQNDCKQSFRCLVIYCPKYVKKEQKHETRQAIKTEYHSILLQDVAGDLDWTFDCSLFEGGAERTGGEFRESDAANLTEVSINHLCYSYGQNAENDNSNIKTIINLYKEHKYHDAWKAQADFMIDDWENSKGCFKAMQNFKMSIQLS